MNSKGQMSVDLLIAVAIMVLSITMASYYVISAFVPYSSRDIDLQASAYRIAMILSEDGGLWVTGNQLLESDWAQKVEQCCKLKDNRTIRKSLKRIGLANTSTTYLTKLSYEVKIPCYLNGSSKYNWSKVNTFFNKTLWKWVWGNNWKDELANLIGLNSSIKHYRYNISICYMNGSIVNNWTIGYPLYVNREFILKEFGKFERIVVIDGDYNPNNPPPDPSAKFRRLVVYVW